MTSKKKFIDNLANTYCRIGISNIQGVGVIAIRNIAKGTNPFTYTDGECPQYNIITIHDNDLKKAKIHKNIMKMITDFIQPIDHYYHFPYNGLNSLDISFYINHSDDPNVQWIDGTDCEYGNFITIKKIKEGDELTINYKNYG